MFPRSVRSDVEVEGVTGVAKAAVVVVVDVIVINCTDSRVNEEEKLQFSQTCTNARKTEHFQSRQHVVKIYLVFYCTSHNPFDPQ
jgi:hypothetical protein